MIHIKSDAKICWRLSLRGLPVPRSAPSFRSRPKAGIRNDAGHAIAHAIEVQHRSDDGAVGSKDAFPNSFAQDDNVRVTARSVVVGSDLFIRAYYGLRSRW